MGRLVEFPLEDGGTVVIAVTDVPTCDDGPVLRGIDGGRVVEQAQRTFEEAIDQIRPAAQALVARLRALADPPDEMHITFGLDLHVKAGAIIAETGADANFAVELTWRRS
ncbi:hypothetical protein GCM10023196_103060 [Actinoallomurus vinaceus]|uniref:Trypsin-co-occurring domain-containing protein n=1 Tax=Actinoallomurus vinaceus TaxID=1080074 RepID=A0ABP8UTM3_9ACTN